MKQDKTPKSTFFQLQEEHSPEQAIQVDRIWKKKLAEQKNKRYTIIMICAVVIMISIFAILINSFDDSSSAKHFQIQQVTYMNTKYTYLQSNIPHLKFLIPFQETKEIRSLRVLGIIFQEILTWIDSNVSPDSKVLFVPFEQSMVNVLGISLGYRLKGSLGGRLTIAVQGIKYAEMTEKNIQLMNIGLPEAMPIDVVIMNDLKLGQYDLIVMENSNFHKQIPSTTNATIIIIRRENVQTSIMNSIFLNHQKLQIIRGRTTAQIRALPAQYGYALIPYAPSVKRDNNFVLLVPEYVSDVEICEETNEELLKKPWVRNLVQRVKNESFGNTSVLYAIDSEAGLEILSYLHIQKLYAVNPQSGISNIIAIKSLAEFQKSARNILIVTTEVALTLQLEAEDKLFVEIANQSDREKIEEKFKGLKISTLSPYNNKGCFYPPALIEASTISQTFILITKQKTQ